MIYTRISIALRCMCKLLCVYVQGITLSLFHIYNIHLHIHTYTYTNTHTHTHTHNLAPRVTIIFSQKAKCLPKDDEDDNGWNGTSLAGWDCWADWRGYRPLFELEFLFIVWLRCKLVCVCTCMCLLMHMWV